MAGVEALKAEREELHTAYLSAEQAVKDMEALKAAKESEEASEEALKAELEGATYCSRCLSSIPLHLHAGLAPPPSSCGQTRRNSRNKRE